MTCVRGERNISRDGATMTQESAENDASQSDSSDYYLFTAHLFACELKVFVSRTQVMRVATHSLCGRYFMTSFMTRYAYR